MARYTIEFLYSDNNQLYSDDVELTDEEHARVSAFLEKLDTAGVIEAEGGGSPLIFPYRAPRFVPFPELLTRWEDYLLPTAKEMDIEL
jgi:hypothetical protein